MVGLSLSTRVSYRRSDPGANGGGIFILEFHSPITTEQINIHFMPLLLGTEY